MIKLLLLEGCKKCKKLKDELDSNGIQYGLIVCDQDTAICDEVEDLTGMYQYPIIIYTNDFGSITNIFYVTDKFDDIGKLKELANGVTGLGFYSIDQLISYILK